MRMKSNRIALAAVAVGALFLSSPLAQAASPFDGSWVIDFPAAGAISTTSDSVCPALRLPFQIRDGRVVGALERVPSRDGSIIVEAAQDNSASPIDGSVAPDGTVSARWEAYNVGGKLVGDTGYVTVRGECGERTGQATRVTN